MAPAVPVGGRDGVGRGEERVVRLQEFHGGVFDGDASASELEVVGRELGVPLEGLLVHDDDAAAAVDVVEERLIVGDQVRADEVGADVDNDGRELVEAVGDKIGDFEGRVGDI